MMTNRKTTERIRKGLQFLFFLGFLCFLPFPAFAQNVTTVSATIVDPNGIPYSNAAISAQLVPTGVTPTINGQAVSGFTQGNANLAGLFTMNLASNAALSPGGTQWQFTVNELGIPAPLGTGPQQFVVTITISGANQDISATLNASAPKLTNLSSSSATIGGAVTATHLTFSSGPNAIANVLGSAVTAGTGAIALTAGADTTTPLTLNEHSATQTGPLLKLFSDVTGGNDADWIFFADGVGNTGGMGINVGNLQQYSYGGGGTRALSSLSPGGMVYQSNAVSPIYFYLAQIVGNTSTTSFQVQVDTGATSLLPKTSTAITNYSSPPLTFTGAWWNGANNYDSTTIQDVIGSGATPTSVLTISNSGAYNWGGVSVLGTFHIIGQLGLNGTVSGGASIGVAANAGAPNPILLPLATGSAGQFLQTDGGSPQQSIWANPISGLTMGYLPKATSATGIGNSLCDEGITTANTMTCTDSLGLAINALSVSGTSTQAAGTFSGLLTANGGLTAASVFTASANGAASASSVIFTGLPFTGGSATTTTPLFYLDALGSTAPTTWVTTGTYMGINAPSGWTGRYLDFHLNGGASSFNVDSGGGVHTGSFYNITSGHLLIPGAAPTISSGFGTSPSIAANNGPAGFTVNVGTGGTASSGVIGLPAANAGWLCDVSPNGAPQAAAVTYSAPTSATSVTLTNYTLSTGVALAWTSAFVLHVGCVAY